MKKVLLIILCAILVISSVACNKQNDVGGENVGEIIGSSDVTTPNNDYASNQSNEPWVLVTDRVNSYAYDSYIYDESGKIIEMRSFNTRVSETNPTSVTEYTYTSQADGSVVVRAATSVTKDNVFYGFELIYNADGLCIEYKKYNYCSNIESLFTSDNFNYSARYEYDSNGNLLKADYPERNEYNIYCYDENGRLKSYEKWNNGGCINSTMFTLDDKGDIVLEEVKITSTENYAYEYSTVYDYYGQVLVKKTMKNNDNIGGIICTTKYSYNDSGEMIKIIIEANRDGLVPLNYFTGDGYFVETICFSKRGTTVTFMPLSQALSQQDK